MTIRTVREGAARPLPGPITPMLRQALEGYGIRQTTPFEVDPQKHHTLLCANGLRIELPPFAWVLPNGMPATKTVTVAVCTPSGMLGIVAAGLFHTHKGSLLDSLGPFHLSAHQEGTPLRLERPLGIQYPVSKPYALPLHLYTEGKASLCGLQGGHLFDWARATPVPLRAKKNKGEEVVSFEIRTLGWWDVAAPLARPGGTAMMTVYPHLPPSVEPEEKMAFLLLRKSQTVAPFISDKSKFSALHIPVGQPAVAVVLCRHKNSLYLGMQDIPKTGNMGLPLSLLPCNLQEMYARLASL